MQQHQRRHQSSLLDMCKHQCHVTLHHSVPDCLDHELSALTQTYIRYTRHTALTYTHVTWLTIQDAGTAAESTTTTTKTNSRTTHKMSSKAPSFSQLIRGVSPSLLRPLAAHSSTTWPPSVVITWRRGRRTNRSTDPADTADIHTQKDHPQAFYMRSLHIHTASPACKHFTTDSTAAITPG